MLLPLLLPLFLPLAALAEGSPDFDFSSNKPRQPQWKQCLLPEKEPSPSDKARFREKIHLQLTSLIKTQMDQSHMECSEDESLPDCKELAETLKPLWSNMRFHLALAKIDKLDDSLMPVWDSSLKHEPSHLKSVPSPGQEETKRIREIWKKEVVDQIDIPKELPRNGRKRNRLKRKILGSLPARSLKEDSQKRYFQILTSMPLLGYLPSENPSVSAVRNGLKKVRKYLENFLAQMNDSEEMPDLISIAPLVEELLQKSPEHCPAAETLAVEQSQSRMWGTGVLLGTAAISAVPCFFAGPLSLSICLMGGLGLGSYGVWLSRDELDMSRKMTLLGNEYLSLSELNEKENAVLIEKALFPLAFWGTTAVPMRAAGELFSQFSRRIKAESILGKKLTPDQRKAIHQAHIVGRGERGKDPNLPAGVNNYNKSQLRRKSVILKQAGFDKQEREQLVKRGIVGDDEDPYLYDDPLQDASLYDRLQDTYIPFKAIKNNELSALKYYINSGMDPDQMNDYGETLLFVAVYRRNLDAIRFLLDEGADPNISNLDGYYPLQKAIRDRRYNIVEILLEAGAKPNVVNKDGWTPLNSVVGNRKYRTARLILDHGADSDIPNKDGWTPVNIAATNGNDDLTLLLLERKADPDIPNKNGWTPLNGAANNGHYNTSRLLIEHGANPNIVNKDGWTPINSAVSNGHYPTTKLLLDHGADPNIPNNKGETPLDIALAQGNDDMAELLRSKGARQGDPALKAESILGRELTPEQKEAINQAHIVGRGEQGKDPYLPAGLSNYNKSQLRRKSVILKQAGFDKQEREQLIKRGIVGDEDPSLYDRLQDTHIPFKAINRNELSALKYYINSGMDPDQTNKYGETLLFVATAKRNLDAIHFLLDEGADPNISNIDGQLPLDKALQMRRDDIADLLRKAGAESTYKGEISSPHEHLGHISSIRNTHPALIAIRNKDLETLQDHVNNGMDPDQANRYGETLLFIATAKRNFDAIDFLLDEGADPNIVKRDGTPPIYKATRDHRNRIVKRFLDDKRTDPNIVNNNGMTSLHNAAINERPNLTRLFLDDARVDPNILNNKGNTPLHSTVKNRDYDITRLLLDDIRIDPNIPNNKGETPLDIAIALENDDLIQLLRSKGARQGDPALKAESILGKELTPDQKQAINQAHMVGRGEQGKDPYLPAGLSNYNKSQLRQKSTILKQAGFDKQEREQLIKGGIVGETMSLFEHLRRLRRPHTSFQAIHNNELHTLKQTLEYGIDPNHTNKHGETLLFIATIKRNIEAIRLLLDEGADPNIPNLNGQLPLYQAIKDKRNKLARLLLERGANPNIILKHNGQSALHNAASTGKNNSITLLLEYGSRPNLLNKNRWTPLNSAVTNRKHKAAQILLDHGADPNLPNKDGWTPFHSAAKNGDDKLTRLLLDDVRVDPNISNNKGHTPLHSTVKNRDYNVTRLLLDDVRVDPNIPNNKGKTPLDIAIALEDDDLIQLLRSKGALRGEALPSSP